MSKNSEDMKIGIKHTEKLTVEKEQCASAVGSGALDVFATPSMIMLMEKTAMNLVQPYLCDGKGTVGTRISVEHSAASPIGAMIICEAELVEIDRRRLVFSVAAYDNCGEIGKGTHERFIIDNEKFMDKVSAKLSPAQE